MSKMNIKDLWLTPTDLQVFRAIRTRYLIATGQFKDDVADLENLAAFAKSLDKNNALRLNEDGGICLGNARSVLVEAEEKEETIRIVISQQVEYTRDVFSIVSESMQSLSDKIDCFLDRRGITKEKSVLTDYCKLQMVELKVAYLLPTIMLNDHEDKPENTTRVIG